MFARHRFSKEVIKYHGCPDVITIDKSGANKAGIDAINKGLKKKIKIRQVKYLNNIVEQEHRFIKRLTRPMLGFKNFTSAAITLSRIEIVRMIKKGQIKNKNNQSPYQQFNTLFA